MALRFLFGAALALGLAQGLPAAAEPANQAPERAYVQIHVTESGAVGFIDVSSLEKLPGRARVDILVVMPGEREELDVAYMTASVTIDCRRARATGRPAQLFDGRGHRLGVAPPVDEDGDVGTVDDATLQAVCTDADPRQGRTVYDSALDAVDAIRRTAGGGPRRIT